MRECAREQWPWIRTENSSLAKFLFISRKNHQSHFPKINITLRAETEKGSNLRVGTSIQIRLCACRGHFQLSVTDGKREGNIIVSVRLAIEGVGERILAERGPFQLRNMSARVRFTDFTHTITTCCKPEHLQYRSTISVHNTNIHQRGPIPSANAQVYPFADSCVTRRAKWYSAHGLLVRCELLYHFSQRCFALNMILPQFRSASFPSKVFSISVNPRGGSSLSSIERRNKRLPDTYRSKFPNQPHAFTSLNDKFLLYLLW